VHQTTFAVAQFDAGQPRRCRLVCWDLGGDVGLRSLWDKYFVDADAAVFVVDTSAPERFEEAASILSACTDADSYVWCNDDRARACAVCVCREASRTLHRESYTTVDRCEQTRHCNAFNGVSVRAFVYVLCCSHRALCVLV
jgi:hypothetical protein